jgi:hypothetical protein
MQKKLVPIKPILQRPVERSDRPQPAQPTPQATASKTIADSRSVPLAPAQRSELPATYLQLEPRPLSAYDDNPVLDETGAAFIVGVTADCLKKWRYRKQGPDYIQYGRNGVVRYELKALLEFRDRHRVKLNHKQ